MTKDGVLVLIHDERVDRTTNGFGQVKDYSYSELSSLDGQTILTGSAQLYLDLYWPANFRSSMPVVR